MEVKRYFLLDEHPVGLYQVIIQASVCSQATSHQGSRSQHKG